MDRVVYSSRGVKLMRQQGNDGRCVCENSFDGNTVDTGLSWQEARSSPLHVVLGDGFNVDLYLKETWSISGVERDKKRIGWLRKCNHRVAVIVLLILKRAFP